MTATMTTREQMEQLATEMRSFADECDTKTGGATAEDQTRLIEMATDIQRMKRAHDAQKDARDVVTDTSQFLADLSDAGGAVKSLEDVERTPDGRRADPQGKTLGELFTESQGYKSLDRYKNLEGIIPHSTKGINSEPFQVDSKALLTGGSATSAGAAVRNDLYTPITDLIGQRELTVADLVTRGSTSSDTVEFVRVTGKTNNAAPTVEASISAPDTVYGTHEANNTQGYKPESVLALEIVSTTVKTIAHWIPITKRAASDAPQVRTLVDNFLRYGVEEELEDQILNGAGTGENFTGILTAAIGSVGSAGTDLDAIVDAIRTIRVTGRRKPTGIVMHPNDWYSTGFLLAKDSTGQYLVANPRSSVEQLNMLWGLNVVVTEAMTENTALVGDFRQAVLWEREGITLSMTDSHSDFFVRNLLVILAEMRAAFGILDVEAFCKVTAV